MTPSEIRGEPIDPLNLTVGTRLQYRGDGKVVTIRDRKLDGTGWWLTKNDGGLDDRAITGGDWAVVERPMPPPFPRAILGRNRWGTVIATLRKSGTKLNATIADNLEQQINDY